MSASASGGAGARGVRVPGLSGTLVLLMLTDISLRVFGFARVMRVARSIAAGRALNRDRALIDATLRRILQATALYPGRSQCLEQSVIAYVLLRRRGYDVQLRIGVQHYPFAAHAWVELDGEPVTESVEVVNRFVPMPQVAV